MIDSQLVKSLLDLANGFLTLLNTPIGSFITQVALLTTTLFGLQQLFGAMNIFKTIATQIANLPALFSALSGAIQGTTSATTLLGVAMNTAFPILAAISVALVAIPKIVDAVTVSLEEQKEIVNELKTEIDGYNSEIEELESKQSSGDLTSAEQNRLEILKQQLAVKQQLYNLKLQEQYDTEQKEVAGQYEGSFYNIENAINAMEEAKDKIDSFDASLAENADSIDLWTRYYEDNKKVILEHAEALGEDYERALEYQEAGIKLSEADQQLLEDYPKLLDYLEEMGLLTDEAAEGTNNLASAAGNAGGSIEGLVSELQSLSSAYDTLESAVDEYNSTGSLSIDTLAKVLELGDEYIAMLDFENGKLVLNTEMINSKSQELRKQAIETAKQTAAERLHAIAIGDVNDALTESDSSALSGKSGLDKYSAVLDEVATGALTTTAAVGALSAMMGQAASKAAILFPGTYGVANFTGGAGSALSDVKSEIEDVLNWYASIHDLINSSTASAVGGVSGGSGGSSSVTNNIQTQNDLFEERIDILEHELFLMEKHNKTNEEQIEKMKEIQAVLHEQAEWYRAQGLDENSEYIRDLQQQWWDYQDKIEQVYQDIADAAKEAAEEAQEAWEEVLESQISALEEQANNYETAINYIVKQIDKEIEALEAQRDAEESYWDEKIDALQDQNDELSEQLELEEALKALAEAKQKKVMVYKDGRFQYVSDIDAVSEAQSNLDEVQREHALAQEVDQLERQKEEALAEIEAQIKAWEKYRDSWDAIISEYQDAQDKITAEQFFGIDLSGDNWQKVLDQLQHYVDEYKNIMDQLEDTKDKLEQGQNEPVNNEGIGTYDPDVDYATLMLNSKTEEEFWKWAKLRAWKAQDMGIDISENGKYASNNDLYELWKAGYNYIPEGYASGTTSAKGGVSLVGENGPELRVLNEGDGIVPAEATKNLWSWGMTTPSDLISNLTGKLFGTSSSSNTINIQNFNPNLPNVSNGADFVEYLKNNMWRETIRFATT